MERSRKRGSKKWQQKNKYYAIKKGIECNLIVESWDECKRLTLGFKNAEFKGFNTKDKAKKYLKSKKTDDVTVFFAISRELDNDLGDHYKNETEIIYKNTLLSKVIKKWKNENYIIGGKAFIDVWEKRNGKDYLIADIDIQQWIFE